VVVAVAIGAMVASAGLVASFDRVEHHPARYGAWWDVVVGDYSDANALNAGIDAIRRNPNVQTAATLGDSDARINGKPAVLISISKVIGSVPSTVFSGRAPTSPSEIALGADLAESLHVRVGGTVSVEARDSDAAATRFTVVGLVVLDNPTSLDVGPGDGALVTQGALGSPGDQIDQEILVRFNPSIGSGQALHSILDQFHAFVVRATPESDVSNLGRIRAVPWYIAALLGLTVCSAVAMVLASCVLGLIIGAAGGPALWYLLANRLGLASGPVVTALPIAVVITAAIALTGLIAGVAQAWRTHRGTTDPLRET
jgi:hypothetical protein